MASVGCIAASGWRGLLRFLIVAGIVALWLWPAAALATAAASVPSLLGSAANSTTLSGTTSVAVSGGYAYTTAYWPGQLTVLDISNPGAPVVVGATPATPSLENASNVTISATTALVVSKNRNASTLSNDDGSGNSLTVVDISNPTNPVVSGILHDASQLFGSYGVAVQGQYAYVASQGILAGQPTSPDTSYGSFSVIYLPTMTIVAHIDNGTLPAPWTNQNVFKHATSVAISGHYAYVTAFYDARVTVVDISNPSSPVIVASLRDTTNIAYPADVAVQGNYVYVANQVNFSNQFTVLDVSNPAKPVVVGSLNNSSLLGAYRIRVRGDFAYVSASNVSTIAAIDITNPASPRLAGSVTDSAHLSTTTGLDIDGSGRHVLASSPRLSTESGATYGPYPGQPGGATNTGTISVIDVDPSPISVTIQPSSEPPPLTTQNTAAFSFSVTDAVSAVQCGPDGGGLGACSSPSSQNYASLAVGNHTFTVQATDAAGNTSVDKFSWTVGTAPANSAPPTVSGAPIVGQTLGASPGTWSGVPAPTYAYQWLRCDVNGQNCSVISSATTSSYVVAQTDVGSRLAVAVTASNGLGSPAPVQSQPTAVVQGGSSAPTSSSLPSVSGTASQGQGLTVAPGVWSGSPAPTIVDQWQRCGQNGQSCTAISGATGASYVVQAADAGSTLDVLETATNPAGSASVTSLPTAVVTSAPQNTASPTVSGAPIVGQTLGASPGTWSGVPAPTYAYLWQRCDQAGKNCSAISAATGPSYTAQRPDVGGTLRAVVTATNSAGSTSASTLATARVIGAPVLQSPPAISGIAKLGSRLVGSPGTWTGYPAPSFVYRWNRCNSHGTGCNAVPGQTSSQHTVLAGDVGFTLRLVATAANSSGSASATSAATAVVRAGATTAQPATWRAFFRGAAKRRASLRIVIPAGTLAAGVKTLTVGLPRGLRFSHSKRQLTKGITIKDTQNHRLTFSAAVTRGHLVLSLDQSTAGVQILMSSPALGESDQFVATARRRHASLPQITVTVAEATSQTMRTHLQLRSG